MSLTTLADFLQWKEFAVRIAKVCGAKIMEDVNRRSFLESPYSNEQNTGDAGVNIKSCCADLVTETDQMVESMIKKFIAERYPNHKFVGEETSEALGGKLNLTDDPTWVVDPIDGTMNFVHKYPGFCISIGVLRNKDPVVGVVYDVHNDKMYWGVKGQGSFCNGHSLKVSDCGDLKKCLVLTETTSRRDAESMKDVSKTILNLLSSDLAALRMCGSAAMNLCRVAEGSADCYYEMGPHIWDVAGAVVILTEAGGHMLHPKTLDKPDLCGRQFLAVGSDLNLARVISPLLQHSVHLECD